MQLLQRHSCLCIFMSRYKYLQPSCYNNAHLSHVRPACFMDCESDVDNPHPLQLCATTLSPCVEPGQVPTPGSMSPPASTGGAAQTKSQAGVTGNASCLVGEGGEGNLTARSHYVGNNVSIVCPFAQCSTVITICNNTLMSTIFCPSWEWQSTPSVTSPL